MSSKTPQSFSRIAENQVADQLAMRVGRFVKAKKNRLALAQDIYKWAEELLSIVQALNKDKVMPSPVPPLATYESRSASRNYGKVTVDPGAFSSVEGKTLRTVDKSAEELVAALMMHVEMGTAPWFLSALTLGQLTSLLSYPSWTNNVKELIEREMQSAT